MSNSKFNVKYCVLLPIVLIVTIFLLAVPVSFFGIAGLTVVQQRVIALFVFAALMWMFEIIPNWTTSLLVIVFALLTVSDKGLSFLCDTKYGELVNYKSLMSAFADPVVMLFLGGFVLAIMAEKYGLDVTLARVLLKPFGTNPRMVLLGFLVVIAVFSMFMSNTATAAMMLAFLAPVLAVLPKDDKGKIGLALAIPIAANLGGIGTPIGTPPNATAVKFLAEAGYEVTFGEWALRMIPFVLIMLLVAWVLLQLFFPFKSKEVVLEIPANKRKADWKTYVVWITFIGTILLWATEQLTGINSNVVALIPLGVFTALGIFTKEDIKEINWSVLWLVAGGFALGTCLQGTGLAKVLIQAIPFGSMQVVLVLVIAGVVCYFLSNFISNSATAALLIPILIVVAEGMADPAAANNASFVALGGTHAMISFIAVCASIAMLFPISTPPNAIASSTGLVETKDMAKIGIIIGLTGFVLGFFWLTKIFPFEGQAVAHSVVMSDNYVPVKLETPASAETLTDNGKECIRLYELAADEIDNIYWKQNYGDKDYLLKGLDEGLAAYAAINYGPWDRLTGESFIEGAPARPAGANFYPADMTPEEFEAFDDPAKMSPYTLIVRDSTGLLKTVWYHDAYKENIDKICGYLTAAADTTIRESVRNYLLAKTESLKTDDYGASDAAWLAVNDSRMDLIIGPVAYNDDHLYGIKASYGAFVLLNDMYRTELLKGIAAEIPGLQMSIPVKEEYKRFNPGTSTLVSADAISYAGNANAGYKVVAVNLPLDENAGGSRTILFQNVISEKFHRTVYPVGQLLLEQNLRENLDPDAFYWNIAFREIAHGLGVKETLEGANVTEALGEEALTVEKIKDNVMGVWFACKMIGEHKLSGLIREKEAVTTFVASVLRSSRFGAVDATGRANIIIRNYLLESGAISRLPGKQGYAIDFEAFQPAVESLMSEILGFQATGDKAAAKAFDIKYAVLDADFGADIDLIAKNKIPVDLVFTK